MARRRGPRNTRKGANGHECWGVGGGQWKGESGLESGVGSQGTAGEAVVEYGLASDRRRLADKPVVIPPELLQNVVLPKLRMASHDFGNVETDPPFLVLGQRG
jgi:hypothetical protein